MEAMINISGLSKSYGHKEILHNVNLQMKRGNIIGLLGPNGSGKTTLIKILCGLLREYRGEIVIDGHPIGVHSKSIISYLPDEPYFAAWMKVKDAIGIFCDMYAEKFQLSLVMARRAKIIILDEPIGGVDPAARDVILDTILSNSFEEQTILIATHLIADIERIFDSVIFIQEGNITLDRDVEELRQETGKSIDELFREKFRY